MKLSNAGCAILAPALSSAAAFAMPEPTQLFAVAADNWSPAPTRAPQVNLFRREAQLANEGNTCGYASGLSGTYFQPHFDHPTNSTSITNSLSKLADMRNKHLSRRPRVLSLV
jgi:hypothetical protein